MPLPTNKNPDSESGSAGTSNASRREQLASRLASLSPTQREAMRKRLAQQRAQQAGEPQDSGHQYGKNAIAIVGMGCRLPGASNPSEYWDLISNAGEAVGPVTDDRWDQARFFDPTGRSPGKMSVNALAALDQVDGFDPGFFGIAPREASKMDPQQRLLLEVAWETFEHAGVPAESMRGSNTGVFVGIGGTDYSKVPSQYSNYFEHVDAHIGTGNALSIAAGRISYLFDLQGPSFIVDTACSSALVAIHSAAVSLLRGESDAAIAGAVNLILTPETTIAFSKARMLSPDGHCRPFDAGANGYVRGEGCGLVMLKRVEDARRDGNRILGILRGSAVNQDGRTSGITAPSGAAQQRVIRSAMKAADVTENDFTYIEAHGTGTPLGDPIELMALNETFRKRNSELAPIRIGSVKANIGHTETVSGIAGLLKVLLMFDHQQIPGQANFDELNPNARLKSGTLKVAARSQDWQPDPNGRYVAGVSSFGFGGTNAHLVVERPAEVTATSKEPVTNAPPVLCLPFSARSEPALDEMGTRLGEILSEQTREQAHDLCGSFATQRDAHAIRTVAIGESESDLIDAIGRAAIKGQRPAGRRTRLAMVFTGQGAQYIKMGTPLAATCPSFRAALDECGKILDPVLPISLTDILNGSSHDDGGEPRDIDHTSLAQPAICAIQCCLVDAYRAVGIRPNVVAGHSIGEIAALYAAGALSREQALLIAAYRGQVMGDLPPGGAMAALLTDAKSVENLISETGSDAVIATMNGPSSTVVAGSKSSVESLVANAAETEIASRPLVVSHAFHSPLMQDAVEPLREKLAPLIGSIDVPRSVVFISALTGKSCQTIDLNYWLDHLMQPVRFTEVIDELSKQKLDLVIEVGPRPQLCGMIRRALRESNADDLPTVASLDSKLDDFASWTRSVATTWCVGANVDWSAFYDGYAFQTVPLPNYPFQRQRYWYDPPAIGQSGGADAVHPLLGSPQSLANGDTVYSAVFRDNAPNYLPDHVVSGSVTVPAAAWIETLRAAAAIAFADEMVELCDVEITRALFLQPGQPVSIQTHVSRVVGGRSSIQISYRVDEADAEWQACASATASKGVTLELPTVAQPSEMDSTKNAPADLYAAMSASGLQYGELFQTLSSITTDGRCAHAGLQFSSQLIDDGCRLHPTLLDGALQLIATVVPTPGTEKTFLPVGVEKIRLSANQGQVAAATVQRISPSDGESDFDQIVADVDLFDADDRLLAQLAGVRLKSLQRDSASDTADPTRWLHHVQWFAADITVEQETAKSPVIHVGGKQLESLIAPTLQSANHWLWTMPACEADDSVSTVTSDLLETIQAAASQPSPPKLSIVTQRGLTINDADDCDPVAAAVIGLARVAVNECPGLSIQVLDVDVLDETSVSPIVHWLERDQSETELMLRDGRFYQPRLVAQPKLLAANDPDAEIGLPGSGSYRVRLDGTNRTEGLWIERIAGPAADSGEVALSIDAVGLNFSDVLKSMGLYPGISDDVVPLGIEVCGRLTRLGEGADSPPVGTRVMGVVPHGFASDDATNDYLVTEVPDNLSDEEAASLPIAFLTAQHALIHVARLQPGESVLIHAGAGGVGLAAIQIAQAVGATIFTTAGHPTKRRLLAELGVDKGNIFNSRDVRSIEAIRQLTDGRGVDVVLNSLPGEWIDASINLLSAHGRFLEIGKIDIYQNRPLGLLPFQDNLSYSAIDLDRLLRERPDHVRKLYREITEALREGVYRPLPITSFRLEELPGAMRFMAARRNIGKIVVSPPASMPDVSKAVGVHLITGGSGSIAQGVARRLIQRGAKQIALVARSAPRDDAQQLAAWANDHGATCAYIQADCTQQNQLDDAVGQITQTMGPVVGVVHTAGVLADGLIGDLSVESLDRVLRPKVAGTIALDRATADQPLKYFTMLGSIAAVFGSPGQANYSAANAFMEGFANQRRLRGLPATVVHWGPWSANPNASGGMADDAATQKNLAARGLTSLGFDHAIDLLIDATSDSCPLGTVVVDADWNRMLAAGSAEELPSVLRWMKSNTSETAAVVGSGKDEALLAQLAELDEDDRVESLQQYFAQQIGHIMSMDPGSIDPAQPLGSLGLDSLMAIELKNTIETRLDITLPISKFMDDPTLESLSQATTELLVESVSS